MTTNLYKQKREQGFTIIEVLIVLSIAGLIILIVFLAVPALQRNSRNTQYRTQVSSYLAAVNEFINNNNGQPPSTAAHVTSINNLAANGQMTEPTVVTPGALSTVPLIGTIQLQTGVVCDTTNIGNTISLGATPRTIAIRYSVESSAGAPVKQCTGS